MPELEESINKAEIAWVKIILEAIKHFNKPIQVKDFREYIKNNTSTPWTDKKNRVLSVVLNRMKDEGRLVMVKYATYPSYYGKVKWLEPRSKLEYFRDFDPYTGNFKTKENV